MLVLLGGGRGICGFLWDVILLLVGFGCFSCLGRGSWPCPIGPCCIGKALLARVLET